MKNINKMPLLCLVSVICFSVQVYSKQKFLSTQNLDVKQDKQLSKNQNMIQSKSQAGQYHEPEQSDMDSQKYHKEDFYLWEEGVTNLAYDDFLTTKFISNIEYLGAGYNAAYANPLSTSSIDPGYTSFHAFEYNYPANKLDSLSGDADYFLPEGISLNSQSSCEASFKSTKISTMKEYTQTLQVRANIGYKGWGFSFKASADYKKTNDLMVKSDTLLISSEADCEVFDLQVSPYLQPKWSKQLNGAFKQLLYDLKNQEKFWMFFDSFGTHVTRGVKLGAQFGYMYEMKKSEVEVMSDMGLSAEISGGGWGVSAGASTDYQKKSKEAFQDATKSWTQFSIGAPPDPDNNGLQWASQAIESPMPIKADLIQWLDFLAVFREGNTIFNDDEIRQLSAYIRIHMQTYCPQYLKPQNIVDSCYDITASKNNNEIGLPNVPNKQKDPLQEFNLINGFEEYQWAKWSNLGNIKQIQIDNDGFLYALTENEGIMTLNPQTEEWYKIENSSHLLKFNVNSGKIVGIFKDEKQESSLYYIDYKQAIYEKINYSKSVKWYSVVINKTGEIIASVEDESYFYRFSDYKTFDRTKSCWYPKNNLISFDDERYVLAQSQYEGSHIKSCLYIAQKTYMNRIDKSEVRNQEGKFIDGCKTDAGWGYQISSNNYPYLFEDLKFVNKGQKLAISSFKIQGITCQSTSYGPLIFAVGLDGFIYKRTI